MCSWKLEKQKGSQDAGEWGQVLRGEEEETRPRLGLAWRVLLVLPKAGEPSFILEAAT